MKIDSTIIISLILFCAGCKKSENITKINTIALSGKWNYMSTTG